jgi:hypothetical protein
MVTAVGITAPFATLPADALHHLAGHLQDGTPLSDVFNRYGDDAAESMKQVLFTGVAQGVGARKIASGLVKVVQTLTRYKAMQIARTESLRAYRQAAIGTYQQNADITDGWVWYCENLPSSCVSCLFMDGTEHEFSEPFFGSHPQCRCSAQPRFKNHKSNWGKPGREWFADQDDETQSQMLGPSMYNLYAAGHVTLGDLVDRRDSPWGPTCNTKSVIQLHREGRISTDAMNEAYDMAKIAATA